MHHPVKDKMTYIVKFKCNLLQYLELRTKDLTCKWGVPAQFCKGFGRIGCIDDVGEVKEKRLSYEQVAIIIGHINMYGLN